MPLRTVPFCGGLFIPPGKVVRSQKTVSFAGSLDSFTTALEIAISSARRLLASYSGPLLNVRRSSDDTTQDINYLPSGLLNTTALLAFCGSGDGFIKTIYDQSGNGFDLTQTTNSAQPKIVASGVLVALNGLPTALHDGTNDTLLNSTLNVTSIAQTSAVWQSATSTWSNFSSPINASAGDNQGSTYNGWLAFTNSGNTTWFHSGAAMRKNGVALTGSFDCAPVNSPMALGIDQPTPNGSAGAGVGTCQIGESTGNTFFLNASLSELVCWSTTADRTAFEANQVFFFT